MCLKEGNKIQITEKSVIGYKVVDVHNNFISPIFNAPKVLGEGVGNIITKHKKYKISFFYSRRSAKMFLDLLKKHTPDELNLAIGKDINPKIAKVRCFDGIYKGTLPWELGSNLLQNLIFRNDAGECALQEILEIY